MFARIVGPGSMLSIRLSLAPAPQTLPQLCTPVKLVSTTLVAYQSPRALHALLVTTAPLQLPLPLYIIVPLTRIHLVGRRTHL